MHNSHNDTIHAENLRNRGETEAVGTRAFVFVIAEGQAPWEGLHKCLCPHIKQ